MQEQQSTATTTATAETAVGRGAITGSIAGFFVVGVIAAAITLYGGGSIASALGLGAFAGFWGGPGFGGMLGATLAATKYGADGSLLAPATTASAPVRPERSGADHGAGCSLTARGWCNGWQGERMVAFATPITLTGPERSPRQMLGEQTYDGHASVHDEETAGALGLAGAPIEGPTHFSQFDPLAFAVWGRRWFETGCLSAHFKTMVIEGEQVTASLTTSGADAANIEARKADGTPVLVGTASVGPDHDTELERRLRSVGDAGDLFILDRAEVGERRGPVTSAVDMDTANGDLYPFSLRQKLDGITEPSPWYAGDDNPWGRPILPIEMVSVLSEKAGAHFPARGPALGLFVDLEVRLVNGPVFVGQEYAVERELVGLGQSRRTESSWVRTTLTDVGTGDVTAEVLLHSGVFKESYEGYPADRL